MRYLVTLAAVTALCGWATAADPTAEITATGTTNGTNSVVFKFEVKNGTVSATNPLAELKINGNVIQAANYSTSNTNGVVTVTVNGGLAAGKATVTVKANTNTGGTALSEKEVDFKSTEKKEEETSGD